MGGSQPLLDVRDLRVVLQSSAGPVHAVRGISFALMPGEIVGIVGESGCGKSVTAKAILGLIEPPGRIDGGRVTFDGRDLLAMPESDLRQIRGGRISMVFQDPNTSLNPVLTIGGQIGGVVRAHQDLGRDAVRGRVEGLLADVGIVDPGRRLDQYPHELSGGMRQRVMIAMALANHPALVLADEPTTALDVTIQAQILDLLRRINRDTGTAIAFISHNLGVVAELCSRVLVVYAGRVVESGSVEAVFARPEHPYTRALLGSLPVPGGGRRPLTPVPGGPPALTGLAPGCSFAPRCPARIDRCAEDPRLLPIRSGHDAACWVAQSTSVAPVRAEQR